MLYGLPLIEVVIPDSVDNARFIIQLNTSLQVICQNALITTPIILSLYHALQGEEDFEHNFLLAPRMLSVSHIVKKKGKYYFKMSHPSSYKSFSFNQPTYILINPHTLTIFKKMLEIHLGDLIHVQKI